MSTDQFKVIIHMVSSLDGFIARRNGDVSWLESTDNYDKGITLTEEDVNAFLKTIDCYVMGSKTYEKALELGWPYGGKPVIVLSGRALISDKENVQFYTGNLENLVNEKLKPIYNNIWVVGGAQMTKDFLKSHLADEIVISIAPIILGHGILFFDFIGEEQQLHLLDVTTYKDGMVELRYEIKKNFTA